MIKEGHISIFLFFFQFYFLMLKTSIFLHYIFINFIIRLFNSFLHQSIRFTYFVNINITALIPLWDECKYWPDFIKLTYFLITFVLYWPFLFDWIQKLSVMKLLVFKKVNKVILIQFAEAFTNCWFLFSTCLFRFKTYQDYFLK